MMKPETERLVRAILKAKIITDLYALGYAESKLPPIDLAMPQVLNGYTQGMARACGVICEELEGQIDGDAIDRIEAEIRARLAGAIP